MIHPSYALAGLAVGFLIGLTGVGSGAVMAPLLTALGVPPAIVVGSDLGYGLFTKVAGLGFHARQGSVDWHWVRMMSLGSMPGALVGSLVLTRLVQSPGAIRHGIGLILVVTASLVLLAELARRRYAQWVQQLQHPRPWVVIGLGFVIGAVVGTTSVGSGSLTDLVLMLFTPLSGAQLVGTGLAHAILLTAVATVSHWGLGNIDIALVLNLLLGSIPGVLLGSRLAFKAPPRPLKLGIAGLILASAFTML
ncbi:MAG TPA: sulfite exporter TauE/SafE family protein [Symbiobacteriaceae bacterium]|nr:sulfite exporter TauE/SafE family protein [Symbiobacteriaceae bacterium]